MPFPPLLLGFLFAALSVQAPASSTPAPMASPPQNSATATAAVRSARALYYTPVDHGLQTFHCDLSFNWKAFMEKASNQAVPDDDTRLAYLKSIRLSVDDDLHGAGSLHWVAPGPPPDASEDSVGKIREGMQGIWSSFFQSWNGYMTGDLLTLDSRSVVDAVPEGYRVSLRTGPGLIEEHFNHALVLQSLHITTPTLDGLTIPAFTPSPAGLLVTTLRSTYQQPPGAPPTVSTLQIAYAPVGDYQLPSSLDVRVAGTDFHYGLFNCTVNAPNSKPAPSPTP